MVGARAWSEGQQLVIVDGRTSLLDGRPGTLDWLISTPLEPLSHAIDAASSQQVLWRDIATDRTDVRGDDRPGRESTGGSFS